MTDETPMRVRAVLRNGSWPAGSERDQVTLTYEDRFRRRRVYVTECGSSFLLDLPDATVMRDGDALELEDGGLVRVRAAPEDLMEVRAAPPSRLARLAWHLGNRHLPTQVGEDRLLVRRDHVIARMLEGLGATLVLVREPFDPDGGAYAVHGHPLAHGGLQAPGRDLGHPHGDDDGRHGR